MLLLATQADPTGLTTPLGKLVIGAGMLVTVVLCLKFLWDQRNR